MKKTLLILAMIASSVLFSCNPDNNDDDDSPSNPISNEINGHKYVDLGLSVKWATCNVGASSPEYYGDYFAWGETETKEKFTPENCSSYGIYIDDISGNPNYDVARKKWGSTWRMPTRTEMKELMESCSFKWTEYNGVNGFILTASNGNSIFIPADKSTETYKACRFWTSTPDNNQNNGNIWSYYAVFDHEYGQPESGYNSSNISETAVMSRFNGYCIRPVSE